MKRLITCVLILLFASTVFAQTDPAANGIGIYFDQAGTVNCSHASAYSLVTAYVVVTRPSASAGLYGWKGHLCFDPVPAGGVTYDDLFCPGICDPGISPPDVLAGGICLPAAPAVPVLTMSIFYLGGPLLLGIAPYLPFSEDPAGPAYAPCDDPGQEIALTPSGDVPFPGVPGGTVVAAINPTAGCPVPAEAGSWGSVKSLYR